MSEEPERIEWWSDEMHKIVGRLARKYARTRFLEREDLRQEACCEATEWIRANGGSPIHTGLMVKLIRTRMIDYCRRFARLDRNIHVRIHQEFLAGPEKDEDARLDVSDALESLEAASPAQALTVKAQCYEFRSLAELAEAWAITKEGVRMRNKLAYRTLRAALAGGYGPAEARTCSANRYHRRRKTKLRGD